MLRACRWRASAGQVFLVTEWCDDNVLKTLEAAKARGEIGLPESSVAGVGRGLLRALAHCHAHGWAHRDVKPENILIADGAVRPRRLRRGGGDEAPSPRDDVSHARYRRRHATRWYLGAPEQFLPRGVWEKAPGNAHARDVWAAGCVMGECLLGRALFRGAGAGDMLRKIAELVGEDARRRRARSATPGRTRGDCLPRGPGRFEETFNVQRSTGHCVSNGSGVSNECFALLREMLRVDPARRITAARAAEHPFFAKRAGRARRGGAAETDRRLFRRRSSRFDPRRARRNEGGGSSRRAPASPRGLRTPRAMTSSTSTRATPRRAPAPRAAPPSAALDAAVPAEPTAGARRDGGDPRARGFGDRNPKRGPKRGPNPRRRGSNLRRLRRRRTTPPRASPRLCARRAWTTPPAATTRAITRPCRRFRRRRAPESRAEDAFSDDAVMR